ncbi:MAG: hypothetical protein ACRC6A_10120, partial [Fusobacteriaceae bacterium]
MKVNIEYIDRMLNVIFSPVRNSEFFENDIFRKSNSREGVLNKIYPILNKEGSILNLDEIDLMFEKYYPCFDDGKISSEKRYLNLLKKISQSFLSHRDGEISFKYWSSEKDIFQSCEGVEKVLIWNSLNRTIPTDILGVLFLKDNGFRDLESLDGFYSNIKLEDKQLCSVLKKGISETHLHASASTDFYNSWKNLMSSNNLNHLNIIQMFDKVLADEIDIQKYRVLAAIYRLLIGIYLLERFNLSEENQNFQKYLELERGDIFYEILDMNLKNKSTEELNILFSKLKEDTISKSNLKIEGLEALKNADVLRFLWKDWNLEDIKTNDENIFLMESLAYIDLEEDELFLEYFFNYLKIKNIFFKIMTQGNRIKGLDNFVSYFSRSTKIGNDIDKYWWEHRMRSQFKDENLKKVEFRISPSDSLRKMKNELYDMLSAYKKVLNEMKYDYTFPKVGIIYHFIKRKDKSKLEKCWYRKHKEKLEHGLLSFNKNIREYEKEKENILKLRKISNLSKYIVGIDGASIENNTEPWVFTSVYESIRDSKNGYKDDGGNKIQSLGFSFHAGEDFRHIITGIRRIEECLKYFKYHTGDRIGHGIALGIDIRRWCEKHSLIILPRGEYFENLIWIWGQSKELSYRIEVGILERQILDVASEIYGKIDGITTYNLWEMYCRKFSEFKIEGGASHEYSLCDLKNISCDDRLERVLCLENINERWTAERLLKAYHCEKYLTKMREPIEIRIKKEEIEIFTELQKLILQKVARDGIIIETNPTSNMAIGELKSIFEHYILNLNKLEYKERCEDYNYLMVSINSDDPSVFNST